MAIGEDKCAIQLVNEDKTIFAETKIQGDYETRVQRCYDSTRFFALQVENDQGQKAMLGMGFTDRNDAFDLISTISDHVNQLK